MISSKEVPMTPINEEKAKPDIDLSMRYHKTGFARARVRET